MVFQNHNDILLEISNIYGQKEVENKNYDLFIHYCLSKVSKVSEESLRYYYAARDFLYEKIKKEFKEATSFDPYCDTFEYITKFVYENPAMYDKDVFNLTSYSYEELKEISSFVVPERDFLFTYTGLQTLHHRYLMKNSENKIVELPQHMYLLISMVLASEERKSERLEIIKKFYELLSTHKVSLATPFLMNCRKNRRQLSSCFVLTVEDDLDDIFENIKQMAMISKNGGGIGVYLGKLRSLGSPISIHKGASSGVIPVVKIINDVMNYVDQLGVRKGSASVTIDIWHPDIIDFLEIKTNVGDERKKAHDIHPAVSIPDIFMKRLIENKNWTLINPYYSKNVRNGKNLEDFYGEEFEEIYEKLEKELPQEAKKEINAFELWKKILSVIFETGEPFIFFRDRANKLNPNNHRGIIYSSNLCMEIVQNMKPKKHSVNCSNYDFLYDIDKAGEMVVCNLASINLSKSYEELEDVCYYTVRMLDNAISINKLPDPEAEYTNKKYRAIGIGVNNYHHFLAKNKIKYQSKEHLEFIDKVFEELAYYTIKASVELAKERGQYEYFKYSQWENGILFGKTINNIHCCSNNSKLDWKGLQLEIKKYGLRNGYLLALMPTGSTSIIIGATPSFEPVFAHFYKEENMSGIVPQFPPDILELKEYYDTAYEIDQKFLIDAAAVRQKWIDQSQSLNLYIDPEKITGRELSDIYIYAWEKGLKTIYYCRSKSVVDIEENNEYNISCSLDSDCEYCQT